jgi:hypothetical protein
MNVLALNKKQLALTKLAHARVTAYDYTNARMTATLVSELLDGLLEDREIQYRIDCAYETVCDVGVLTTDDIRIEAEGDDLSVELYIDKSAKQGILFDTKLHDAYEPIPAVSLNSWGKVGHVGRVIRSGDDGLVHTYNDGKINVYTVCYDMFKPIVEKGKGYCINTPIDQAIIEIKERHGLHTYSMCDDHLLSLIKSVYPDGSNKYYANILKELNKTSIELELDSGDIVYGLLKSVIV